MGIRKQISTAILSFLIKKATWKSIFILFGLITVFNLIVFPLVYKTNQNIVPLDLQFSYSPEKAHTILSTYSDEGLEEYAIGELTVDIIYPMVYVLFLSFFVFKLTKKSPLSWFPLLIFMLDCFENIGIVTMVNYFPQKLPNIVLLTSLFTSMKWILIGMSILLILVLLVTKLFKEKKES